MVGVFDSLRSTLIRMASRLSPLHTTTSSIVSALCFGSWTVGDTLCQNVAELRMSSLRRFCRLPPQGQESLSCEIMALSSCVPPFYSLVRLLRSFFAFFSRNKVVPLCASSATWRMRHSFAELREDFALSLLSPATQA